MHVISVVNFFCKLFIGSFLTSRVFLFFKQYRELGAERIEDLRTYNSVCENLDTRSTLGRYDSMCHDIKDRIDRGLLNEAILHVLRRTHLCGDQPCAEVFHDYWSVLILDPLRMILSIAFISIAFMYLPSRLYRKARGKWDDRHDRRQFKMHTIDEPVVLAHSRHPLLRQIHSHVD